MVRTTHKPTGRGKWHTLQNLPAVKRGKGEKEQRGGVVPRSEHCEHLKAQLAEHMRKGAAGDEPHLMSLKTKIANAQ